MGDCQSVQRKVFDQFKAYQTGSSQETLAGGVSSRQIDAKFIKPGEEAFSRKYKVDANTWIAVQALKHGNDYTLKFFRYNATDRTTEPITESSKLTDDSCGERLFVVGAVVWEVIQKRIIQRRTRDDRVPIVEGALTMVTGKNYEVREDKPPDNTTYVLVPY